MPYRLFIPRDYDSRKKYHVILWLHGGGGRGNDNLKQISEGNTSGSHIWISETAQSKYPSFVLAPQCPEGQMWTTVETAKSTHQLDLALEILAAIEKEFAIDTRRRYVAGQSMGGLGSWSLIAEHPGMFAAAIPVCGGGDEKLARKLVKTAIWAFHGTLDQAISVERTRRMIAAVRSAGGHPKYTEYTDLGHNIWDRVFHEVDLLDWVFAQTSTVASDSVSHPMRSHVKTGYVSSNGARLFYEQQGRGFPLVFVSGGGVMDRRCWDEEFQSFAKYFSVIRYDVRGIGKSERPKEEFSHSHDLYELLKALKVKRAHVIGLSVGGAIAIDFTLEYPEMVDHLVLATSGLSDDAKAEENQQGLTMLSEMTQKRGIESVAQLTVDAPFVISKENETQRERIRRIYIDNRDVFESGFPIYSLWRPTLSAGARLSEIHAPTLVVRGDKDNPAYIKITDKVASAIPKARKLVIPSGTHFINLDKPKEFAEAVLNFLRS